jgi:hypothetical protein
MPQQTNPISALWDQFEAGFLPPEAGDTQRRQLRIAFFAGAAAALSTIASTPDPKKEPTRNQLFANMDEVQRELLAETMDAKFKQ